jgi:hypothetical protein
VKRPCTGDLLENYYYWRRRYRTGWGLAWYIASELCERFYSSHGIVPLVIAREGLGYYGIGLRQRACRAQGKVELGRLTMSGNVENWETGSPGDHGLKLSDLAEGGKSPDLLLGAAIEHMRFSLHPAPVHSACRHKRWGASFVLSFRLLALLALRWNDKVQIWNDSEHIDRIAGPLDDKRSMPEHPGYFLMDSHSSRIVLAGDGRFLLPAGGKCLWRSFMMGASVLSLLQQIERTLSLSKSGEKDPQRTP